MADNVRNTPRGSGRKGVYGFTFPSSDTSAVASGTAASIDLDIQLGAPGPVEAGFWIGRESAQLALRNGGHALLQRDPLKFRICGDRLEWDALLHPLLAGSFAVAARWLGREAFHAGAFVHNGHAVAITGDKGNGKSTALAQLAIAGSEVLTDDLLIVDADGCCFAGPRFIDLRRESAQQLGHGELRTTYPGDRERWRVRLDDVTATYPLGAWIHLEWSDTPSIERMSLRDNLMRLIASTSISQEPVSAPAMLDLAGLPSYLVKRPREWATDGASALLGVLGS